MSSFLIRFNLAGKVYAGLVRRGAVVLLIVLAALAIAAPSALAEDDNSASARDATNQVNPQQLPDSSFIYDTDIYALNTSDTYFDNQTVQVTGEIVGDRINAEALAGKCWLTLSALPDATASTVQLYVSESDAAKIDTFGRYGSTGTTVTAMGTYHLVCSEHDGLSDLHVDVLTVVESGQTHEEEFKFTDFWPGIVLLVIGGMLLVYYRRLREMMR